MYSYFDGAVKLINKMAAGVKIGESYFSLKTPNTIQDIQKNQEARKQMLQKLMEHILSTTGSDVIAARQFWATQTCVFVRFLQQHQQQLNDRLALLPNGAQALKKNELRNILARLLTILAMGSNADKQFLIDLIKADSQSAELPAKISNPAISPTLCIQSRDAIAYARQLIKRGERVIIMDAANAQRPGAGAYHKGTFQEALTRHTDLYWKFLADFDDVYARLQHDRLTTVSPAQDHQPLAKEAFIP